MVNRIEYMIAEHKRRLLDEYGPGSDWTNKMFRRVAKSNLIAMFVVITASAIIHPHCLRRPYVTAFLITVLFVAPFMLAHILIENARRRKALDLTFKLPLGYRVATPEDYNRAARKQVEAEEGNWSDTDTDHRPQNHFLG